MGDKRDSKIKEVEEISCPSCGAEMRFDPVSGRMVCDYCGRILEINADENATEGEEAEKVEGFDFSSLNDQAADENAADVPIYNCNSCGAELIAEAQSVSLTCPYCGSNVVLTQKVSGKLRPDAVIPFQIDSATLPGAVQEFYKEKPLLSKKFFSESTMGKVTGVYVPFWVFNGRLSGKLSFSGEKSSTSRRGDYKVTDTEHYRLDRNVSMEFENIPVDASGRIDDALMDSLEPFDLREAVPFDMRYLAGFAADRFDEKKDTIEERAKERMLTTADNAVRPLVGTGYSNVKRTGGELSASLTAKYMLFPVYMYSIAYEGKQYEFATNGQTGKTVGNLPTDVNLNRKYFLKRFGIVAASVFLFFVGKYLLGR